MFKTLTQWLRGTESVTTGRLPTKSAVLGMDRLESREVPAFLASWSAADQILWLTGTSGDDTVTVLQQNGAVMALGASPIQIKSGSTVVGSTTVLPSRQVREVRAYGYDGNDTVKIQTIPFSNGAWDYRDYYLHSPLPLYADGGDDNDTLVGNNWNYNEQDTLYGGRGNDRLEGNGGNDKLYGQWDHDVLVGGSGDDLLDGGSGNDVLSGDTGKSYRSYAPYAAYTSSSAQRGGDDTLKGGSGSDILLGEGGDDTLYGQDGNDHLAGGWGNDGLFGGGGVDHLYGEAGADRLLVWRATLSDQAFTTLHGVSTDDAVIRFRDTFSSTINDPNAGDDPAFNTSWTQLAIDPDTPGLRNYSKTVPMRYEMESWNPSEIEKIDSGLKWMHQQVGNTSLLKDSLGRELNVYRFGKYVNYDLTDSDNNGRTDADNMVVEEARAANAFSVGAWNLNERGLAFTETGIRSGASYLTSTTIHELAHNWDNESVFWGMWLDQSGWAVRTGTANAPSGKAISGDGAWFHDTSAEFAETYSKWSPYEDWATTFEAYFEFTEGRLSATQAAQLADKFEFIDAFLASKRT